MKSKNYIAKIILWDGTIKYMSDPSEDKLKKYFSKMRDVFIEEKRDVNTKACVEILKIKEDSNMLKP